MVGLRSSIIFDRPEAAATSIAPRFLALLAFGIFCALAIGQVSAQPAARAAAVEPVEIRLERSKVAVVDGKEVLQPSSTVKPGEVLRETATYTNRSATSVSKVEATLPIPANTEYVVGSAQPQNVLASTDGKTFAAMSLKRKNVGANGVVTEVLVPVTEYRFLRWSVGTLAAGKSAVVSARVKVSNG